MPRTTRTLFRLSILPLTLALVLALALASAPPTAGALPPLAAAAVPPSPDYVRDAAWLAKPARPTLPVDVFYVYPTVLMNGADWLMDTADPAMCTAARVPLTRQASVFEGQANIYAPMYRQANIAVLGLDKQEAARLNKFAVDDVWRALTRYLEHENNGRPFFLAGHSQGSKILTELMLAHWGSLGVEQKLVAALLPGWSMTKDDLAANPAVVMCDKPERTGCVISYNAMAAGMQGAAPTLLPGAVAVNPLSWTMDTNLAPARLHLGAVFFDENGRRSTHAHFASAQIVEGGLVVQAEQPQDQTLLSVPNGLFPAGVYHRFDYALFYENLRENIARRIAVMRH